MSKRFSQEQLQGFARVSDSPLHFGAARKPELPRRLYTAAAVVYLVLLGVAASLLLDAGLALSMMILANLVVLVFGLAAHWAMGRPGSGTAPVPSASSPRAVCML